MIAALGRMCRFNIGVRGAIANHLAKVEGREIIKQMAVCCGVPAAVDCQFAALDAFADMGV
jgi:4-carboxymuconolactone decarboxylase